MSRGPNWTTEENDKLMAAVAKRPPKIRSDGHVERDYWVRIAGVLCTGRSAVSCQHQHRKLTLSGVNDSVGGGEPVMSTLPEPKKDVRIDLAIEQGRNILLRMDALEDLMRQVLDAITKPTVAVEKTSQQNGVSS